MAILMSSGVVEVGVDLDAVFVCFVDHGRQVFEGQTEPGFDYVSPPLDILAGSATRLSGTRNQMLVFRQDTFQRNPGNPGPRNAQAWAGNQPLRRSACARRGFQMEFPDPTRS